MLSHHIRTHDYSQWSLVYLQLMYLLGKSRAAGEEKATWDYSSASPENIVKMRPNYKCLAGWVPGPGKKVSEHIGTMTKPMCAPPAASGEAWRAAPCPPFVEMHVRYQSWIQRRPKFWNKIVPKLLYSHFKQKPVINCMKYFQIQAQTKIPNLAKKKKKN